ncbi:TrmB family transcriptional regulator [Desulfovibrio sp. TomC]|uniref:TrmB family transcriptional regulator n=1 Tax=Desulfovibrio sp. TomC TaxID=1562888 RepID=UPI000574EB18|nr:helix-turn-helix domain-containing protein [Desulfovibrio sp. TomC]KHK03243.1 Transcriptional regulator, TrmB family [Desulfovibrio sp. TomC]
MIEAQELAVLGLTSYEAAAYLALLGRPELAPAEVAARGAIPRQRVYDVLASLTAKGLCLARDGSPRVYAAVAPAIALELLAGERTAQLARQRLEAEAAAARLTLALAPIFAGGRGQSDPLAYAEVLTGPTRIAHRALALARGAAHRVHSCITRPMILSNDQNKTFMEAPLGRGLAYRALCDAATVAEPGFAPLLDSLCGQGLEVRLAEVLPLKMQAFDDETVLLSMQDPAGGPPSFTAVVIHNRGVAAMLNLAFEQLWAGAKPYPGGA